jgi:hypothetical protein
LELQTKKLKKIESLKELKIRARSQEHELAEGWSFGVSLKMFIILMLQLRWVPLDSFSTKFKFPTFYD